VAIPRVCRGARLLHARAAVAYHRSSSGKFAHYAKEHVMRCFAALLTAVSLAGLLAGCGSPSTKPPAKVNTNEQAEHHHYGPHGGLVAAVGEKDEYHIEWTHDHEKNSVTLIVLDAKKAKEVPIAMEKLELIADGKPYALEAVNPQEGKASRFELADPDLMGVIESLGDKVTAEVKELDINGEKFSNVKLVEDHDHD
jgi:hypothetical protein